MTEREFLTLMQDVLKTEVFVHNATKVHEARQEVSRRLGELRDCHRCSGRGWVNEWTDAPMGANLRSVPCPTCGNHTIAPPANVTVIP